MHLVVEQRRAHLERMGHRHAVDLREQGAGEVGRGVEGAVAVHARRSGSASTSSQAIGSPRPLEELRAQSAVIASGSKCVMILA